MFPALTEAKIGVISGMTSSMESESEESERFYFFRFRLCSSGNSRTF